MVAMLSPLSIEEIQQCKNTEAIYHIHPFAFDHFKTKLEARHFFYGRLSWIQYAYNGPMYLLLFNNSTFTRELPFLKTFKAIVNLEKEDAMTKLGSTNRIFLHPNERFCSGKEEEFYKIIDNFVKDSNLSTCGYQQIKFN